MQNKDLRNHIDRVNVARISMRLVKTSYSFRKAAEGVSKRFLAAARALPAGAFLGFQFNASAEESQKTFALCNGDASLTQEDFAWVFRPCADVYPAKCVEDTGVRENRRVYSVSGLQQKGDGARDNEDFQSLLAEMKEVGASLRLDAGPDASQCRMLLSLPDGITLRMQAMLSLAFPGAAVEELRENGTAAELSPESLSNVLLQLLYTQEQECIDKSDEEVLAAGYMCDDEEFMIGEDSMMSKSDPASIENLELSVRAYNSLKRAGIENIDQLKRMTTEELLSVRNLGKKCVSEIREKLAKLAAQCVPPPQSSTEYARMLEELIGLSDVKEQVRRITAFARMQKVLQESGKAPIPMVMNMEFIGNPGTAKTTVARILAGLLHEIGLLSSNELVEVGRADLVARYEGQTADKVQALFRRAKGKLLFIDEAYSLVECYDGAFGDEAINTIVQEMENNREDTIVIFAGYPKQMNAFFDKNPGLRSRVPFQIRFCDYSAEELWQISELEAQKRGFTFSEQAVESVISICTKAANSPTVGNGRFCRNLVETAVLHYAARLFGSEADSGEADYVLQKEDVLDPCIAPTTKVTRKIGFNANCP